MIDWHIITRFGDLTIMFPIAIAIAGWLLLAGEQRSALWWSGLFTAGMAMSAITKIAFMGWGMGIESLDFTGISGHAIRAAAVIPVLFFLILQRKTAPVRWAGVLAGFALAALIGYSRLMVHAHSVSEAVSGLILGSTLSLTFMHICGRLERPVFTPLRIAFSILLLLAAPYAKPAPTQRWLMQTSLYLSGHDKPCERIGSKSCERAGKLMPPARQPDA